MSHTTSYAILEVNPATFEDIRERLHRVDQLDEYLDTQDCREILVFGTVALAVDPLKAVTECLTNSSQITRMTISTRTRSAPKWKDGDRKLIRKKMHVYRQQHANGGWLVNSRGKPRMEWVRVDGLIPPDGDAKDWVRVDWTLIPLCEREHDCYQEWTCDGHYLIRRGDPEKRRIAAMHTFGKTGFMLKDFLPKPKWPEGQLLRDSELGT